MGGGDSTGRGLGACRAVLCCARAGGGEGAFGRGAGWFGARCRRLGMVHRPGRRRRHRVYLAEFGRSARRDPLGSVDGMNVYAFVMGRPITMVDPTGLDCVPGLNQGQACRFAVFTGLSTDRAHDPIEPSACQSVDRSRYESSLSVSMGVDTNQNDTPLRSRFGRFSRRSVCLSVGSRPFGMAQSDAFLR